MLVKWKPFYSVTPFQRDMNSMFDSMMRKAWENEDFLESKGMMPEVNITEKENEFTITASIPGMAQKDIDLEIEENRLTIKGERKEENKEEGENFLHREISYGSFSRSFSLPSDIKHDEIKANYKDGLLEVILPKAEEAKAKKIEVN